MNQRTNAKGITLIALVVTILVLLILAGVSIGMLSGENGIIKQANESKLETRAGNVKEEVSLWKSDNQIRKNTNQEEITKEQMLQDLKDKKLIVEEEINKMTNTEIEELYVEVWNIDAEINGELKINNFDDVVENLYTQGIISENSKESFYNTVGKEAFINELLNGIRYVNYNLIGEYNWDTKELIKQKIVNPEGEKADNYLATSNGDYTFIV